MLRGSAGDDLASLWSKTRHIEDLYDLASKAERFTPEKLLGGILFTKSVPPLSANLDATLSLYSGLAFSGSSAAQIHAGECSRALRDALISLAHIGIFVRWSVGPITNSLGDFNECFFTVDLLVLVILYSLGIHGIMLHLLLKEHALLYVGLTINIVIIS